MSDRVTTGVFEMSEDNLEKLTNIFLILKRGESEYIRRGIFSPNEDSLNTFESFTGVILEDFIRYMSNNSKQFGIDIDNINAKSQNNNKKGKNDDMMYL